jgi:hypothetical protein
VGLGLGIGNVACAGAASGGAASQAAAAPAAAAADASADTNQPTATATRSLAPLSDAGPAASATPPPPAASSAAAEPSSVPSPSVTPSAEGNSACNEQQPQDFLVRANFLRGGAAALERAIQWRTDTYGYFKGFGHAPADAEPPSHYVVPTTFMGLPVQMHRKVVPALRCVEEEIRATCADHPYKAQALAGIRFRNTYRGGEVTNHIYGIAIDVDPSLNTCCGCVKPWNNAPACQRPAKTEYDRMAMPECWVHAFERYGFYWLGHDVLRDTMHFEFLGDPDRILKNPGAGG